jgi:hypothetical protein
VVKFLSQFKKKLNRVFGVVGTTSKVPFHFEIHADKYLVDVVSEVDKSVVFELFFKGLKKLRVKSVVDNVEGLPSSFSADKKQLKALESLVVNKDFLNKITKQIVLDIPSFKIIDSGLGSLSWEQVSPNAYKQSIRIIGVCYYEE